MYFNITNNVQKQPKTLPKMILSTATNHIRKTNTFQRLNNVILFYLIIAKLSKTIDRVKLLQRVRIALKHKNVII